MKIISIVFLLFIVYTTNAQNKYRDSLYFYKYDKETIRKNKIAKIFIENSIGNEHESIGKDEVAFDKEGSMESFLMIGSNGDTSSIHTYKESKGGDIIMSKGINYHDNKKDTTKYLRFYNRKRKLITDSVISKFLLPTIYYEYDDKDRIKKETKVIIFSEYTLRTKQFIYDSLNVCPGRIKEVFYKDNADTTGIIISDRILKYNKAGKLENESEKIRNNPYMPQNKGTTLYYYDKFQRLIESKSTDGASFKYEYNDKGLLASEEQHLIIDEEESVITTKFNYQIIDNRAKIRHSNK